MNNYNTIAEIIDQYNETDFPVFMVFIEHSKPVARTLDGYRFSSELFSEIAELINERQ